MVIKSLKKQGTRSSFVPLIGVVYQGEHDYPSLEGLITPADSGIIHHHLRL
jgi:hypothetical protein